MSAWERLPFAYRRLCEDIGTNAGLSPQNRRVRQRADQILADRRERDLRLQGDRSERAFRFRREQGR